MSGNHCSNSMLRFSAISYETTFTPMPYIGNNGFTELIIAGQSGWPTTSTTSIHLHFAVTTLLSIGPHKILEMISLMLAFISRSRWKSSIFQQTGPSVQ